MMDGKIDVFAQDINVTQYTLKNNFSELKFNHSGLLGKQNDLYLCVSPKSEKGDLLFETLSRTLEILEEDGTLKVLKKKYNITN